MFGGKEDPDLILERSLNDLAAKQEAHTALWGFGSATDWAVDLEIGEIRFNTPKGWVVTAPVQVVGTYNATDGSWLWGWDHPSVPAHLGRDAALARDFGKRHGLEAFTTRKIVCEEADAWQFTALASYLAKAQGGYRGPSGSTYVFMTFGEVAITKP